MKHKLSVNHIKEAKIPNFIEIISHFLFEDCYMLQITFSNDPKLQKIRKFAFCNSTNYLRRYIIKTLFLINIQKKKKKKY